MVYNLELGGHHPFLAMMSWSSMTWIIFWGTHIFWGNLHVENLKSGDADNKLQPFGDGRMGFSQAKEDIVNMNLVGGLEYVSFFHILGIIIPIDFHIFQGC